MTTPTRWTALATVVLRFGLAFGVVTTVARLAAPVIPRADMSMVSFVTSP